MKQRDRHQWVLNLKLSADCKSVLHVIAHRADADSLACYTSMPRLATDAGMSERQARKVVRELESLGMIAVSLSSGKTSNRYTITVVEPDTLCPTTPARCSPPPGKLCPTSPAQQVSDPGTVCHLPRHSVPPNKYEQGSEQPPPAALSVWDIWVSIAGESKRAVLGKLIKAHGEDAVAAAVAVVSTKRPAEPVSYLRAILTKPSRRLNGTDRTLEGPL